MDDQQDSIDSLGGWLVLVAFIRFLFSGLIAMLVYLVDDDPDSREMYAELWGDRHEVKTFEMLADAANERSPDLLVIDISSLSPVGFDLNHAYAPICSYIDRSPSVAVHIVSFVSSRLREDVVNDVLEVMPDALLTHGTIDYVDSLLVAMEE